jgi:hypothetical protein
MKVRDDNYVSGYLAEDLRDGTKLFFWYEHSAAGRQSMECHVYHAVWRLWPMTITNEEKASLIVNAYRIIHQAQVTQRRNGNLKELSDEARLTILHEIPRADAIPKDGFPSEDKIKYPDCLSAGEIEDRIKAELERLQLTEWFKLYSDTQQVTP